MQIPLLDLKAQYAAIRHEVEPAIKDICENQTFILGPKVQEFEAAVAAYCGSKFAVGVSSGSDALLMSLMAANIKTGDEVITTAFTFFATAGAIVRAGATPVFVDIDPDTYNIDPALIAKKITAKTKAIMPVHLYGQVAPMKPIIDLAKKHDLVIIEDACQSIGAKQNGIRCGNFGDYGCFSFFPSKNLGCFGDGGLVTTNDEKIAATLKLLRDHGQNPRYYYKMVGGNFRLDALQAAVLNIKLKYLDGWSSRRRQNASHYDRLLVGSVVKTPKVENSNISIYNQYTIAVPRRDELQAYLTAKKIGCAIYYPVPLHLQECFKSLGYKAGDLPVTERCCKEVLSLPIYPELLNDHIERVAESILVFYK
ncbi:MAG: DegT/DnrJ/EryC1/StrS family aminotransferase [Sedimentisphaerales bacterium]|nr:DegT/DnrJ/EryC1/StrS family aminotransferase [Sedimentisphaerales bacterium]